MKGKQKKMFKIALCVFALEASKGHLSWKVTELERKSKYSRTIIYRYFGSNKKEIFISAFEVFNSEFYKFIYADDFTPETLVTEIKVARNLLTKYPEFILFYQKWRTRDGELKKEFERIEANFDDQLRIVFPNMPPENIEIVRAFLHGLLTAPFITEAQAELGCRKILQLGLLG